MLHYLGVLALPTPKTDQDQTPAFGPDHSPPGPRFSDAEGGSALFSQRDGDDVEPAGHEAPRFASLVVPAWF